MTPKIIGAEGEEYELQEIYMGFDALGERKGTGTYALKPIAKKEEFPEMFTELDIETEEVKMREEHENRQRRPELQPLDKDEGQLDLPEMREEV